MSKIEKAVSKAEAIARDNTHGYDQNDRWGNPNYDCSGLVIDCCQDSGIPVKTNGATYTGNIRSVFLKTGFKDVIKQVNVKTGAGLKRGDVLLGEGHVAFYCGNGKLVHASINEKGKVTGGKSGDQTGKEICVRSYYNKPWTSVLRYAGESTSNSKATTGGKKYMFEVGLIKVGSEGPEVLLFQKCAKATGDYTGKLDSEYGPLCEKACKAIQERNQPGAGIIDGECGVKTWPYVLGL